MAGEVEQRILDAATAIFLQYGFAGASLEKIADAASASKATLYSRYSGKEALFSEVVKRSAGRSLQAIQETPRADSLQEQLALATRTLVTRLLSDEVVGLIRMVVADAPRFPMLAKLTHDAGRLRAIDAVATVIAEHAQQPRDAHTQTVLRRQAKIVATQILDAIVAPLLMRAMLGHDLDQIRGEIRAHIKQALAIFMAAKVLDPFL
jgi:AcrR family transcriptional regulator